MAKTAFVFPGQGSQYVGMGRELANEFREAREVFAEADKALGRSLSNICFEGPDEVLRLTVNTQPAILTTSIACLRVLEARGVRPDFGAGHSLGEYSALVSSGSLTFTDAVVLVEKRGRYMQEAVPEGVGAMAAILGLDGAAVEAICRQASGPEVVEPANYNCPGQVVIAGHRGAVDKAMALAKEAGAKRSVLLAVSGPFHCSLMAPAGERLQDDLQHISVKDPLIPIVANIDGEIAKTRERVIANLVQQVDHSVQWEKSIQRLVEAGVEIFVEVGPGKVLSGLIRKIHKDAVVLNVEDLASMEKTLAYLKGSD